MKMITVLANYSDELNNTIKISQGAKASGLKIKFSESKSSIEIGENSNLTDSEIILGKGSRLIIGGNCTLKGKINIGSFSSVIIGNDLSVTKSLYVRAVECTKVIIGNDCLIASDVTIRTNDGHPIYDTSTKERINSSMDVNIGEHVWLGDEAAILKGVTISDGSIVAMRSVVTKNVPEKCIVAGIPAKVIRNNCTWEHSLGIKTDKFYD